jgi:hypothetical protein
MGMRHPIEPPRAISYGGEGGLMRRTEKPVSWVVYRMTIHGKSSGMSAVCDQAEWDAMEIERPGYHALILAGIANEGEAERLARSSSGYGSTSKPSALTRPEAKQATKSPAGTTELNAGEVASLAASGAAVSVRSSLP